MKTFINSFAGRFPRIASILPWAFLVLITFLAHITYIYNGFVWLDHGDIEGGAAILAPTELLKAFISPLGGSGFFRPTSTLLFSIDHWIYGVWAPGYHITNIVMQIALAVTAVFFARKFFGLGKKVSFIPALVVGIHPLSWLTTGALAYRGEILVTLFTFLAIISYINSRTSKRLIFIFTTLLFTLLALFSKETAIFWIPALIVLWEFLDGVPLKKKGLLPILLTEIAVFGLYFYLRMRALPEGWVLTSKVLPFTQAVGTRLEAFSLQIFHLVSPMKPNLSDAISPVPITHPLALFAIVCIVSAFYLIWRFGPRSTMGRTMLFGGIALAPALNFVAIPRFTSPHYGFFAVIGAGVLAGVLLRIIKEKASAFYSGAILLFVLWVGLMFTSTVQAGSRFRDDFTLFSPETALDKNFIEGHYYLGTYFFEKGNYSKAEKEYESVVYPENGVIAFVNRPPALINLARVKAEMEEYEDADRLLEQVAVESPTLAKLSLFNRAVFAVRQKNDKRVVELLESLPGGWQKWDGPEPLQLLLQSLINLRRFDEADEVNAKLGENFSHSGT